MVAYIILGWYYVMVLQAPAGHHVSSGGDLSAGESVIGLVKSKISFFDVLVGKMTSSWDVGLVEGPPEM
jgi:hypothetical protein